MQLIIGCAGIWVWEDGAWAFAARIIVPLGATDQPFASVMEDIISVDDAEAEAIAREEVRAVVSGGEDSMAAIGGLGDAKTDRRFRNPAGWLGTPPRPITLNWL